MSSEEGTLTPPQLQILAVLANTRDGGGRERENLHVRLCVCGMQLHDSTDEPARVYSKFSLGPVGKKTGA